MWNIVIGGLVSLFAVGTVAYVVYHWDTIVHRVRSWLIRHQLQDSILSKAFAKVDQCIVAGRRFIRLALRVKRKDRKRVTTVETYEYDFHSDKYEALMSELDGRQSMKKNVLHLL